MADPYLHSLVAIVDRLTKLTREHFDTENELMRKYGYPQYRDHRDEHERLLETLQSLGTRVGEAETSELVDFFKDWVLRHTLLTDRQYIDFFTAKGVR